MGLLPSGRRFRRGDVMDLLEDDKMMRHWEDVSKEEEKIMVSKN